MATSSWIKEFYKITQKSNNVNEMAPIGDRLSQISSKLNADIERTSSLFVHFDHIQGESEIDRYQIFSNLLKAAVFLGLNVEKIDFHRKDA